MLTVSFDFRQLTDRHAFYQQLAQKTHCPFEFGNNLDALWDWLTGGMALPACFRLRHTAAITDEQAFRPVFALLEEAEQVLEGHLRLQWD